MTRAPVPAFRMRETTPLILVIAGFIIIIMSILIGGYFLLQGEQVVSSPELATPPYPWIVLNGGDGGTEEFNSWKIRVFYFVEQSYLVNPAFTDSLFKTLGLTYQMSDSTFIGTAPVIQQNTPVPNVQ